MEEIEIADRKAEPKLNTARTKYEVIAETWEPLIGKIGHVNPEDGPEIIALCDKVIKAAEPFLEKDPFYRGLIEKASKETWG